MKKLLLVISCVLCLVMLGCGSNVVGARYPNEGEMQKNLEDKGYQVVVTDELGGENTGTYLSAIKGDDYIEFYWLENANAVKAFSEELKSRHHDYNEFNSKEDDSIYGSYVFCGTSDAVKSARIVVRHDS